MPSPRPLPGEKVRLRVEVQAVVEYDADPEDYGTADPAEIATIDQVTAEEDIYMFLDSENTKWTIKVAPCR